ncbi:glycosyltransferase [Marinobacter orientalis]|uniref:Glycosyltransferase n=1 Tax=Marinobacter orientalis TaxID=1928859 RepID=A0A7Y0WTT2_9GAMM|nr:glycosyltransferase [Marinobacter orientalis]TGX48074.1 glycosyltransferase [Marinobacter orientalis]
MLHVITGLGTGGAERALFSTLEGGLSRSIPCHVLSLTDKGTYGDRIEALGVPVHALHMKRGLPTAAVISGLRRVIREVRPDILQGWMYHGNLAASLGRFMAPGFPSLAWNVRHSLYGMDGEKTMTRYVIRAGALLSGRPDVILYNSETSRRQHEAFGFSAKRGLVIPNGFDLNRLSPSPERGIAIRKELEIPLDAIVIGHVGRLHPLKDHPRFLRAAVRLIQEESQDIHVVMSGLGVGYDTASLASTIPAGLIARFHLLGERRDVPDLMCAMNVFCQSSWSEAFPNVLGEAMAAGVPCVATDVGDSGPVVGDTGVVVPPSDDEALFCGLRQLLGKSVLERQMLGEAARSRVAACYGREAVVAGYVKLYKELAGRKPHSASGA